jgi:pimeloyl-ACP methyl ester carboxylesterase
MRRTILLGLASAIGSAAAAAVFYRRYRRDMHAISKAVDAGSRIARTASGPIEYGREGSGAPALVIHGAGGGYDQGLLLGRALLGPGFDIIAPSRFGYLGTAVPDRASPADQADAHAALLDSLDVPRAIVVGVSAGAPSAIETALRHPARVAALILAVPRAYAPGTGLSRAPLQSAWVYDAVRTGADFAFWCAIRFARSSVVHFLGVPADLEARASPQERAAVTEIMRSILPVSRRVAGLTNDGATEIRPWPLERIDAPTLVISAQDDGYGTLPGARYTAGGIPGAELVVLESGGHLMVGRGDEVRARIAHFLDRANRVVAAAA